MAFATSTMADLGTGNADAEGRRRVRSRPSDDMPDPRLFWRWVGRALRPYAGWVVAGLGGILILAGYMGVSRNALVAKQLPYLISGGIGGVALIGIGAVFLGTEELRRDSGRLDRLERMVLELHAILLEHADTTEAVPERAVDLAGVEEASTNGREAGVGVRAARTEVREVRSSVAGVRQSVAERRGGGGQGAQLVALPVGHSYHRPDCTMVAGKPSVEVVTDRHVEERDLKPCRLCEPEQSDLLAW